MAVEGRIEEIPAASHPDLFDYRAYLLGHGIIGRTTVKEVGLLALYPEGTVALEAGFFGFLSGIRRAALRRIDEGMGASAGGVMRAILLGDTTGLDPGMRDTFARAGVTHIFSVSGLHTAFLALLVFSLCRFVPFSLRATVGITTFCLLSYCALVGFMAPVVRSTIMAFCLMIPFLARRGVDNLNALSIGALLTILLNPLAPYQIDFQFSYLCVLGLITLGSSAKELLSFLIPDRGDAFRASRALLYRRRIAWNHWGAPAVSLSVVALLSVLPLLACYFHQISFAGILANLVLVPFSSLILFAGWAMTVLGFVAPESSMALGKIAAWMTELFVLFTRFFAAIPLAAISMPSFPWWLSGGYYLALYSGAHMRMLRAPGQVEVRRSRMLLRWAVILALVVWWPIVWQMGALSDGAPGDFEVSMIDVGQGDSLLLSFPNGKSMLIDAGPPKSARVIQQYLRSRGLGTLSAVLLTHGDADHIGGAADIVGSFGVAGIFTGSAGSDSRVQMRLDAKTAEKRIPVRRVARGDMLSGASPVSLRVLNPGRADAPTHGMNEGSVALSARYGDVSFLFTGDAGARAEREMIAALPQGALEAQALKVGHHGSGGGTTQAFLDAVKPRVALLSVGVGNRYGHPNPEVVQRLQAGGARVYDTSRDGVVELRTDGKRLWVRCCKEQSSP